jgi:basic membrane protein A
MNKLYAGLLAVILIIVIVATAYFAYFYNPAAPATKKIGLILGTGGLGDKSFNDIAYAGVVKAQKELGITFSYAEPKAISEYQGFQTEYAKSGQYALIVCIGFDQADALNITAQAYPNQNFAIVDSVVEQPNVASLTFKANEGSFLTGVVAGMFTQTNKVGFVGGMDIPLIRDFYVGYKAGVLWAKPSATVLDPVFVGGWGDPTKGKELAVSLYGLGADGVFAAAGKSGLGALEAAHENGKMGFGVDSCQDYLYPEIVASATKRVDVAVYEMISDAISGQFEGGSYSGGLAEKWTGCSRLPDEEKFWENTFNFTYTPLPTNVYAKLTEANTGIINGTITVPSGYT